MTASISKLLHSWLFIDPSEHHYTTQSLKEKLPQAFMQIGWIEQQKFGQIWIIQSRDTIFKGFINFVYVALSGGTLLISVMSQQHNCLMELYTIFFFLQILLFMKINLPSSFILRYVRAEMNVHAFMNELDQKDYWYPRKIKNLLRTFITTYMYIHTSLYIHTYNTYTHIHTCTCITSYIHAYIHTYTHSIQYIHSTHTHTHTYTHPLN